MSNQTVVKAGTQGDDIDVATTTDADGNLVQYVVQGPQNTVGALSVADDAVYLTAEGQTVGTFQVTGTFAGLELTVELTADGSAWAVSDFNYNGATIDTVTLDAPALLHVALAGASGARIHCISITSGTATIIARAGVGAMPLGGLSVFIDNAVDVRLVNSDITLPVSGEVMVVTADETITGVTFVEVDSALTLGVPARDIIIQIEGDLDGTIVAETCVDGTNWHEVAAALLINVTSGVGAALDPAGGVWVLNIDGRVQHFRVRCTVYNSGTATVSVQSGRA